MRYIILLVFIFINIYAENKIFNKADLTTSVPSGFYIVEKLEADITSDELKDIVWSIESKNKHNTENYLYIFKQIENNKFELIFDKKNILPTYKVVDGAMSSYNVLSKNKKLIISLTAPVNNASSAYFFEFSFKYVNDTHSFKLISSIYREINDCDHDDIGKYKIESFILVNKSLSDFNSDLYFEEIHKQWQLDNKNIMKKIVTQQVTDTYKAAMGLYENKDYKKLKLYVDDYIIRYAEDKCLPRSYMDEYLFLNNKKNIGMTNDIAFFLEQTKNYEESVYLLEKIIEKFPNRTVAYLNLGDAYWGLENKEKAKIAYQTYIKQMKALGKEKKIPAVVMERIKD